MFAIIWIATSSAALAQSCPVRRQPKPIDSGYDNSLDPSARQLIAGTIFYHQNLRTWFGLRPDTPICGQSEFELVPGLPSDFQEVQKHIETSRGCQATIVGKLIFRDGKEHASAIVLETDNVVPDPACTPKPELPDNKKLKPQANVRKYDVTLAVSFAGDGSVHVTVRNQDQVLHPWQAYMTYQLDNERIFSATCSYGFVVSHVSSKPAGAFQSTYDASLDISSFSGNTSTIAMTYTCTRVVPPGQ